jgi:peptide subunit release factor 1 (eRF1)
LIEGISTPSEVISSAFFILVSAIESAANFKEKYNDSGFTTEVVTDYPEKLAMLDEANKSIQTLLR